MNRYQRLIAVVAAINVLMIVLFPPFNDLPLAKGGLPTFEGFHPFFLLYGVKPVATDLLSIQLFFVLANTLAAILFMQNEPGKGMPPFNHIRGITIFVAVNGAIVLLFPPFEPYPSLVAKVAASFDSFNFILGNRVSRPIYAPLLYLECIFILINALFLLLLFNAVHRHEDGRREQRESLLSLAERMNENELAELTSEMRDHAGGRSSSKAKSGASANRERRHAADPNFQGPDRRRGRERRRARR